MMAGNLLDRSPATARWRHAGEERCIIDLPDIFGDALTRLPYVMRILAENSLRHAAPEARPALVDAVHGWLKRGYSNAEIAFAPRRILMHDTTCGPALVDIAALRDQLAAAGHDPASLNPMIPIDVSTDHSLSVEHHGAPDAAERNLAAEFSLNEERYRLMKWAGKALSGLTIHPPGTGIMHTINLEQLATIVDSAELAGALWAVPDTLIGTDSHTPMINGIGVLGWGVGGIEAEAAMFGVPLTMRVPNIVGVHLRGEVPAGVLASDVALTVTHRLRQHALDNAFVEFFGAGAARLPAATRATIANMAPEFGGASGYFPIDGASLGYLRDTGRPSRHAEFVEAYAKRTGLWFDPNSRPVFSAVIDVDLADIRPSLAGPLRPQDRIDLSATRAAMAAVTEASAAPVKAQRGWPVAIAAITSCTSTSDVGALIAAGRLAQKAVGLGLQVPSWVKTSLAPGSPAAAAALERAGLMAPLSALGFDIVGYGCTTCIGQSGPLAPAMVAMLDPGHGDARAHEPVAVISGNRNFPGRIHPQVGHAFLGSPALVVAFALAGDVNRDIAVDPISVAQDGKPVYLADLWPDDGDVAVLQARANVPADYAAAFAAASASALWDQLPVPSSPNYDWDAGSRFLRPPPFCAPMARRARISVSATPLLVLGDDITTDHISPAGRIPVDSDAGRYLIQQGERPDALGVYAGRRGNWEVMRRGLFTNPTLVNLLDDRLLPGRAVSPLTGEEMPLWACAAALQDAGLPAVVFAGERYGMGSSRDWAAKGLHLLGVRVVLASSFERIHRANLIGMGIVPLRLAPSDHPTGLGLTVADRVEIDVDLAALQGDEPVTVRIMRAGHVRRQLDAVSEIRTAAEIRQIRAGGILPLILERAGLSA